MVRIYIFVMVVYVQYLDLNAFFRSENFGACVSYIVCGTIADLINAKRAMEEKNNVAESNIGYASSIYDTLILAQGNHNNQKQIRMDNTLFG